jgi:N-acetylglucosaminyl-diphospho-decaprenol L-rhamnosyltransferase
MNILISIVSHSQLQMICSLLEDIRSANFTQYSIFLTLNIPEDETCLRNYADLPVTLVRNSVALGFGENHNRALAGSLAEYYLVVNPDIRLPSFNIQTLLQPFAQQDVGAVAPLVLSPAGGVDDSFRKFPKLSRFFARVILRKRSPDYKWDKDPIAIDWAAGMFVAYRNKAFNQIGGFDSRYFMYLEDADICLRLKMAGWHTLLQPRTSVVHHAQRASRKSFRHLKWHLASAIRFLCFPVKK